MNADQFQHQILSHSDTMYRMARSILRDESQSQDAYQDLVMRLWEKREKLQTITNNRAFVLTSMRNLCLDLLRKKQDAAEIPESVPSNTLNPHQLTEQADTMQHISRMIDTLPEMQRTIIRLRDVEELELHEIAETMQMTENAVTVNLSRARKKLRDIILTNQQKERLTYAHDR